MRNVIFLIFDASDSATERSLVRIHISAQATKEEVSRLDTFIDAAPIVAEVTNIYE